MHAKSGDGAAQTGGPTPRGSTRTTCCADNLEKEDLLVKSTKPCLCHSDTLEAGHSACTCRVAEWNHAVAQLCSALNMVSCVVGSAQHRQTAASCLSSVSRWSKASRRSSTSQNRLPRLSFQLHRVCPPAGGRRACSLQCSLNPPRQSHS